MKASVIGSPISHSLSPAIFSYISLHQGKGINYSRVEVKPAELVDFLEKIRKSEGYIGLNVTLPLKELILSKVGAASVAAKAMGAVNVVHIKDHKTYGHNTDVVGIEKTFQKMHFNVYGSVCLLWGAGGSAKAVAFVLGKLQAKKVFVYNRGERGEELAKTFSNLYPETLFQAISDLDMVKEEVFSLMINTTPLGMQGHESGEKYFEQSAGMKFTREALAFDLIYVPEMTDFLKVAEKRGLKTVGGLGMLIDQALATWKIWFGPLSDEGKLHEGLKVYLRGILKLRYNSAPVYLAGFMGVGKSTVGKELSEITKKSFIDTDKVTEENSGKTIAALFSEYGEEVFRKKETESLIEVSKKSDHIVSLGGGALKSAANLKTIEQTGKLIYLEADAQTLEKRITEQGISRPLLDGLQGEEKLKKISALLNERKSSYDKAHVTVKTAGLSSTQVCFEIISKLGEIL
jgi:shikimate dehydrogenase